MSGQNPTQWKGKWIVISKVMMVEKMDILPSMVLEEAGPADQIQWLKHGLINRNISDSIFLNRNLVLTIRKMYI